MKPSSKTCSSHSLHLNSKETFPDLDQLPTVTIVTVVFNRADTIATAIESVAAQTSDNIEYLVIDGMSDDGTDRVIDQHRSVISTVIRESDRGLYDALNKGIANANGDIIGFVHADDMLAADDVVQCIQKKFVEGDFDAVYGDLKYVDFDDPDQVIRYWEAGEYKRDQFKEGWMPPHPTVFFKKSAYRNHGNYRIDFGSGADYECLIRLMYKAELKIGYVNRVITHMRVGGASNATWLNRLRANRSDRLAWLENGLKPPFAIRIRKPLSKLSQFFRR
jgi:glycosyltransferase